ncbi:hypothetical protein D9611_013195 [Ephemerocybe angulata]|uniref:Nephrocystin 3-like N-terminal domain-containing protein n=1 Tax=Ephemerocybe angulata TaxID=980116 RepID=A0A8H5BVB0_9AGAR|nr:hypothetical protein D9611_013195 [Tulosesus angulatus]
MSTSVTIPPSDGLCNSSTDRCSHHCVHNYYAGVHNLQNVGNAVLGRNYGHIGQQAPSGDQRGAPERLRGDESPSIELLKVLAKNVASSAIHDSDERFNAPRCMPETRTEAQEEILNWISEPYNDTAAEKILWVTGPVGTGKTAILSSIAERCKEKGHLAASFFFSPFSADRRCLTATLASQLLEHRGLRGIREHILSALQHYPFVLTKNLKQQFDTLILGPLLELKQRGGLSTTAPLLILLIDGLEECDSEPSQDSSTPTPTTSKGSPLSPVRIKDDDQREVLYFLLHAVNNPFLPFRVVLTSRPERAIRGFFGTDGKAITRELVLDDEYSPDADIARFCDLRFSIICHSSGLPTDWPGAEKKQLLLKLASGRFICAAKIMRFIEGASLPAKKAGSSARLSTPSQRLDRILSLFLSPSPLSSLDIRSVLGTSRETADSLYGTEAWNRYEASHKDTDLVKAVGFYQQAQIVRAEGEMDERIEKLHRKGTAIWSQYCAAEDKHVNSQLVTEAIDFYNQALIRSKGGHHLRPGILIDLTFALLAVDPLSRQNVAGLSLNLRASISV